VGAAGSPGVGAPTVVADPSPDSFVAPPPAPGGFRARTPEHFTLPDPQHPRTVLASSTVWSWVDGAEVLTVEAGTEAQGQLPWKPDDTVTRPVNLTGLGPAQTALRSDGPEVRVVVSGRGWVRVRGTGRLADVVRFADKLRLR
jgi:hypothetical protein